MNGPTMDEYGDVINSTETYAWIAFCLQEGNVVITGWTDQAATHYDILFSFRPNGQAGSLQGGIRANYLFISIMRIGAFAFDVRHTDTAAGYYAEKLGLGGPGETDYRLAELINGVKKELLK